MISIFEFDNYRKFLQKYLSEMPNKGYGQLSQIARFLGVHTTLVSQILKGHKSLTTDQAAAASDFFCLNELESDYFVLLVQFDRAGNTAAKNLYKRQINKLKVQSQNLSKRIPFEGRLSDYRRAIFYSDWAYSAVRQSLAIPGITDVKSIADYLDLPKKKIQNILDFLLRTGLCKNVNGQIKIGPSSTHIESDSPLVRVHHTNWRQQAIQSFNKAAQENLHYTSPLTISIKDSDLVKEKIIQFIEQVNAIVDPSPSEVMYCLNIDWFKLV